MVVMLLGLLSPMYAQTYDKMWKTVEEYKGQKDLPKSALGEAMKIYAKAKAERNVPQMMKAYLTAMECRTMLTPDSLDTDLAGLRTWAEGSRDASERAVLYSILAEYTLSKDVKKGAEYLTLSLKDKDALLKVSAADYRPMVTVGKTSREYFHDNLYDLLARRAIRMMERNRWKAVSVGNAIERLPENLKTIDALMHTTLEPASAVDFRTGTVQIYQHLLNAYNNDADRAAWLLTGVDAMAYLWDTFGKAFRTEACADELRSWMERYKDSDVMPEVYGALATYYLQSEQPALRLQTVREGIARYPRNARINLLKNIEKEITAPYLSISTGMVYPKEEAELHVHFKNVPEFTLLVYRVNLAVTSPLLENRPKDFEKKRLTLLSRERYTGLQAKEYEAADTVLTLRSPEAGLYYLKAVSGKQEMAEQGVFVYVSALLPLCRTLPNDEWEVAIVDSRTGHPVPGAELVTFRREGSGYQEEQVYPVNDDGTVSLPSMKQGSILFQPRTKTDRSMRISSYWKRPFVQPKADEPREELQLYTDRNLYRPGQTVHVSGIAYTQREDDAHVSAERSVTLQLYRADGTAVSSITVRTNEWGSFSGEFALPSPCLTGGWSIQGGKGRTHFRVEEYKRPTFDVTFEPVQSSYAAGDSIRLVGKAKTFAGAAVQGAKVRYRVIRANAWYWRTGGGRTVQWEGEVVTNADGTFEVPVRFEVEANREDTSPWHYIYKVEADVTNGAGETRQGFASLPLGSTSLLVGVKNLPREWVKERKPTDIRLTATNLSGEPKEVQIAYQVWNKESGKQVLQGVAASNTTLVVEDINALPSGKYRLLLSARDEQGRECQAEQEFVLFSLKDKRPPFTTTDWFYQDGNEFDAASPATLYIGSSEKDVYLFYDVFAGDKHLESRRIQFTDSILSFSYPYQEAYGDGIRVCLAFVKNGQQYVHNVNITRPQPDKKLQLKWTSFRDKLRPGQQEEWTLCILRPDGTPADAELLATLYDASLDKLYEPYRLAFHLSFPRRVPSVVWHLNYQHGWYMYFSFPWKRLNVPSLAYSSLWVPLAYDQSHVVMKSYTAAARNDSAMDAVDQGSGDVVFEEEIAPAVSLGSSSETAEEAGALQPLDGVQLRQNFAETAFFYPQLRTNAQGEVSISFTLPESLTRWRFLGLAHTKDVDYGTIEAEATASKDFMLQPNLPRFLRVGDKASISASLINLSDKAVRGTVRMELFNPETDKVLLTRKQKFSVAAQQTETVSFAFTVGEEHMVLACRWVADGDTFSDGEQQYLPVLTDKQWMTESLPLNVDGAGTYTFPLERLFNNHSRSVTHPRLTVEFTGNPSWYAVQALPAMANPQHDDVLSWATAYYAQSLAASIVKTHPRIQQVFDSWLAQGGTKDTFFSNLQKDEELKNILLAETPWLTEATDETEQKRRIATLFDLNTTSYRLAQAADKLETLQTEDGSWSWYAGMSGSRIITTEVMQMLARLKSMTGNELTDPMNALYEKGWTYLTKQAEEEYLRMQEAERKGAKDLTPSEQTLTYLYIGALNYPTALSAPMNAYFVQKLASRNAALTIYGKALGAIVLSQAGKTAEANAFLQSLLQYSVSTPELGRYFDTPKAHYSWRSYKLPTEVAAIEALHRLTKDEAAIDEMKRWLLKQKQTQTWADPIASADAVYALLTTGSTDLFADDSGVEIQAGKDILRTSASDALGYIKQTVSGNVMNIRDITVRKSGMGMGWGAVYAQYFEQMSQVDAQGNGLTISRELRKDDKVVDTATPLQVGDRLTVRLTVRADRDMDFVQIKDDRAACVEPATTLSGYRWNGTIGYYQATKDASTQFFIDRMRKGTYTLEYDVFIHRAGEYQAGIATIQSAYAPEFGGNTAGIRIIVK